MITTEMKEQAIEVYDRENKRNEAGFNRMIRKNVDMIEDKRNIKKAERFQFEAGYRFTIKTKNSGTVEATYFKTHNDRFNMTLYVGYEIDWKSLFDWTEGYSQEDDGETLENWSRGYYVYELADGSVFLDSMDEYEAMRIISAIEKM